MQIVVSEGGRSASVVVSEGFAAELCTAESLAERAREAGIVVDEAMETRLAAVAAEFRSVAVSGDVSAVFAESVEPVHGGDGWIEWSDGRDPQGGRSMDEAGDEAVRVDHYAGSQRFITVKVGDLIGTVHPPEPGTPGCDVFGKPIAAKPGRPCDIKPGPGIDISRGDETESADGPVSITATADGVLRLNRDTLEVTRLMEVPGNVDFSTGHIDFDGSVSVREGVRDRFRIKASGDVSVGGLVEAATIMCRGHIVCRRGVAGRGQARIIVGGNLEAGFLNDLRGRVDGSLTVRREIMGCELIVGGEVFCPKGSMIGGTLIAAGRIAISALGSEAQPTTIVRLGEHPLLIRRLLTMDQRIADLTRDVEQVRVQLAALARRPRTGPELCVMLEGLKQRAKALLSEREQAQAQRDDIARAVSVSCSINARIDRIIHPKVCIKACGEEFHFEKPVKGPLHVVDRDGRPRMRIGEGELRPLTDFTGITLRRAA